MFQYVSVQWLRRLPWRHDQRGMILVLALCVMAVLMGLGTVATFSGYTNLMAATNFRLAAGARTWAEANIDEALYRLALRTGISGVIVPDPNDPGWQVSIHWTTGDHDAGDDVVSTIQNPADWPVDFDAEVPAVTLQYKRAADGKVVFYNRTIPPPNLPFLALPLPKPLGPIASGAYDLLCDVGVGGLLGLCPGVNNLADAGNPVIQIRGVGFDARGARREFLAEAARSVLFPPPAPLSSGVDVNFNGAAFIDGVNHHHNIYLTEVIGTGGIYGDNDAETTQEIRLLGLLVNLIKDSPDDNQLWPLLDPSHGIANPSLTLLFYPPYTSYPRLFNKQISATDYTPAWVGLGWPLNKLPLSLPPLYTGLWIEQNVGYASGIALAANPTIVNDPVPTGNVWKKGIFSWRVNNQSTSLIGSVPAPGTVQECSPAVVGAPPLLVCRPSVLAEFPTFQEYVGLGDVDFQNLLDSHDTDRSDLDNGLPPLGFTYIEGNYVFNNSTASVGTNDFGVIYVSGNLTINGNQVFKGLVFVDGSLKINGRPVILGSMMVRGVTDITTGVGNATILYSRKATELGLEHLRLWRLLSWTDMAIIP